MTARKLEATLNGLRILAVDDEQEILKIYDLFLKHQGYQVSVASNAEQCMVLLQSEKPDVVLLDVNMPNIDGLRLLEMIRASEIGKSIPIIMISARRDEKTIKAAAELGCDNFIIKPFNLKEIAKRIASELMRVDVQFVRDALVKLRVANNSLLSRPGLQEYNRTSWDSYPFTDNQLEFCIIIKRGIRAQGLIKASDEELSEKVRVFFRYALRWRKVWPES